MRTWILSVVMAFSIGAAVAADGADEVVRVPILEGVYSVEAPADWNLDVSGEDLVATFSEKPGADGTFVIAPPNPMAKDIKSYTRMAVTSFLKVFGNGEITDENERKVAGFPAYNALFTFTTDGTPFVGWARTVDIEGYAVQSMAVVSAKNYVGFMEKAGPIADSYELNLDEVEAHLDELKSVGRETMTSLFNATSKK